jgi:hypothetical protein
MQDQANITQHSHLFSAASSATILVLSGLLNIFKARESMTQK